MTKKKLTTEESIQLSTLLKKLDIKSINDLNNVFGQMTKNIIKHITWN